MPLGNPGEWVTTSDYPPAALRGGVQGTTSFRLTIDRAGRVTDCAIVDSSGSEELDTATCKLVRERARFSAATDSRGRPAIGTYANRVRWALPKPNERVDKRPFNIVSEYTFVVDTDGTPSDCRVIDQQAAAMPPSIDPCQAVMANSRSPVRDASGRPVRKRVTIKAVTTGEVTLTTTFSDP